MEKKSHIFFVLILLILFFFKLDQPKRLDRSLKTRNVFQNWGGQCKNIQSKLIKRNPRMINKKYFKKNKNTFKYYTPT